MTDPDLFVVCGNCASEVSPYVTECPYCGHRLRKRAPDLRTGETKRGGRWLGRVGRSGSARAGSRRAGGGRRRKAGRRPGARLFARRQGKFPGVAPLVVSDRPAATTALIVLAAAASIAINVNGFPTGDLVLRGALDGEWWKLATAPLIHFGSAYALAALLGAAIFAVGLERRYGPLAVAALWLATGAAGVALELVVNQPVAITNGAGGVAGGLMIAWLAAIRAEGETDIDHYGVLAVGAVLLLLPLATTEVSVWSTVGGAATGAVLGWLAARFLPR